MKKLLTLALLSTLLLYISGFMQHAVTMIAETLFNPIRSTAEARVPLQSFGQITSKKGWILQGNRLYWTKESQGDWFDITPPALERSTLQAVYFLDEHQGWVVSLEYSQDGPAEYTLSKTSDGGKSWEQNKQNLFRPGEQEGHAAALHLQLLDSQNGWLVVRQATSSNFNHGVLFSTIDGGDTWKRLEIPIGDPVQFASRLSGWVADGTTGKELYRTVDGGQTWQSLSINLPMEVPSSALHYKTPIFENPQNGVLPVLITQGDQSRLDFLTTTDGGTTWQFQTSLPLAGDIDPSTPIPIDLAEENQLIVVHPESDQVYHIESGAGYTTAVSQAGWLPDIVEVQMASPTSGWAKQVSGYCQSISQAAKECTTQTALLHTSDAGFTWKEMPLPGMDRELPRVDDPPTSQPSENETKMDRMGALESGSRTWITIGQAFDKCEVPTLDKLQTWAQHGPYAALNLYIGGVARSCSNQALNVSYLTRLSGQGWKFIPTWVGPQAPCYSRPTTKMSSDPAVAYQEGISEAEAAAAVATNLGLTLEDGSGAVIYYDLESYNVLDTNCHIAARSFVNGWSERMVALGLHPGLYGYGPAINDYDTLNNPPEFIWPAHWIYSTYNPDATVWNVYGLSNELWTTNTRLRQYAGPHVDSWGGISITVDSNVLEGAVSSGRYNGDYDNDGFGDIFAVDKASGLSGMSEVRVLNGTNNYQNILVHLVTGLHYTGDQWVFELGDYNFDGIQDLYGIFRMGGQSGGIEVHILDGADGYQSFLRTGPIALNPTWIQGWSFHIGDYNRDGIPDLYAIDHAYGLSGFTEVHVLDGADDYQSSLIETPTALGYTEIGSAWAFSLGDYDGDGEIDLAAMDKSNGSSGNLEVHILSGADDFQTFLLVGPTGLPSIPADEGWAFFLRDYDLDGIPDLYAVNKANFVSGLTEVTIMDGSDEFLSILLSTVLALPATGADCSWDFLTGQCSFFTIDQPYNFYLPFIDR